MNHFEVLRTEIKTILRQLELSKELPAGLKDHAFSVEMSRDKNHGDLSTNVAMVLSKPAAGKPLDMGSLIVRELVKNSDVKSAEIAGPGFINIYFSDRFWWKKLEEIISSGLKYGDSNIGQGRMVNVEYVSANPTGPLHVGHGRGAVVGDVIASLLDKVGFNVTKEYYVNDAGNQVDILGRSLYLRYCEKNGVEIKDFPEHYYPGEYIKDVAEALKKKDGSKWLNVDEAEWFPYFCKFATDYMMGWICEDLKQLGVQHDIFTSEKKLIREGAIEEALGHLEQKKLIYKGVLTPPKGKLDKDWEKRPQMLFRSTDFGDDLDRPIKKSDGSWTYFATDMAYHLDKYKREFPDMINIWGADHGGYVARMNAVVGALTNGNAILDVKLCQMVNVMEGGQPIKMSKRMGKFISLRDVIEKVGKGVFRFIVLTRKNDAPLDFDLSKVVEQSRDNPVYYVQYSHARCHSVLRHAKELFSENDLSEGSFAEADLELLTDDAELSLIKSMANWPRIVEEAALAREPHRIVYYLIDLSSTFHALWTKGAKEETSLRFISSDNKPLTMARLALVSALSKVIASGLHVMGVDPVEEMR